MDNYQDEIEEFVDNYTVVLKDPSFLHEWTKEVKEIVKVVINHEDVIRTRVLELDAHFYNKSKKQTKVKTALNTAGRVNGSSRLQKVLPAPRNSPQKPSLLQAVQHETFLQSVHTDHQGGLQRDGAQHCGRQSDYQACVSPELMSQGLCRGQDYR